MSSVIETAPKETLAKKACIFYQNTYGKIPVGERIVAGVALNLVTGGGWGLAIRTAGSAVAGHATYEGVRNWADKSTEEVSRFKRLHRWMAQNEKRKERVSKLLGVSVAVGTFLMGELLSETVGGISTHVQGAELVPNSEQMTGGLASTAQLGNAEYFHPIPVDYSPSGDYAAAMTTESAQSAANISTHNFSISDTIGDGITTTEKFVERHPTEVLALWTAWGFVGRPIYHSTVTPIMYGMGRLVRFVVGNTVGKALWAVARIGEDFGDDD